MWITCNTFGSAPIYESWSTTPTNSLVRLIVPHGCDNSHFTVHVNALYYFTAIQTNDTTLLATTGFVLVRIDDTPWADNGLY
jgi:hypothetical protein